MAQLNNNSGEPNFAPPDPKALEYHWDRFEKQANMYKADLRANYGRPYIISISGKAGSGKSTMVEVFKKLMPASIVVPFAAPLKHAAASLGWRGLKDEKGRKLLQTLGTEIVQDLIDPNHWVNHWLHGAHAVRMADLILCDDMRFPHEIAMMKSIKAVTIRITGRAYNDVPAHRSERTLKHKFDYEFSNTGSLTDIETYARMVVSKL